MESFCLRDAEFNRLVRNANLDFKKSVKNSHLVFWEGLGLERAMQESAVNTQHPSRAGSEILGREWRWTYLAASPFPLDSAAMKAALVCLSRALWL